MRTKPGVTKILFVCHGNICRSPMAEYIMRDMVKRAGGGVRFEIASAATSFEEQGRPVYPPVRRMLTAMGLDCSAHRARRIVPEDIEKYDMLIGMDRANVAAMRRMFGSSDKISMLLGTAEVADPWYTDDFEAARRDVLRGCRDLLGRLEK